MKRKRILAFLLALVITGSMVLGLPVIGSALETEVTDAYALHYTDGTPFYYGSRYGFTHSFNDPQTGSNWYYSHAPEMFDLVYTGGGQRVDIPVYCTDADTNTRSNMTYRRIDLEDCTYYPAGAAQRLRSVLLHSFPYLTVEQVASAVNESIGQGTVTALTQGEVITATQQAIWSLAHGEKYTVRDHYTGLMDLNGYNRDRFLVPESLDECVESAYTKTNITALYDYFMALEGMAPQADAVSEHTFEDVTYEAEKQADGTYTVTVTYQVNTTIQDGDALTFRATCGDQVRTSELVVGAGSVCFEGLTTLEDVVLEINGYQLGGDVYLFDSVGDRETAQSMIGYDATRLPVHGEVVASPERVITIHKTTTGEEKKPLANIVFDVYLVATMEELEKGQVSLGNKPTDAQIEAYQQEEKLVTTLTTDENGLASFSLTENGQPDGVYLVVERPNAAVLEVVEPFFVAVPGTSADGSGHIYTVHIYPKNLTESGPDINKDVTQIGNDSDTFDVGKTHTWIIRSTIPAGIAEAKKYQITDTLDYRLTYRGALVVRLGLATDLAGEETVTLEQNVDYLLTTAQTTDDQNHSVDSFSVSLTAAGMTKIAQAVGTDGEKYELRVYFDAVIDQDAQMGEKIPNQAKVEYTNGLGLEYDADSDRPEVHTGGLGIWKVDARTGDNGERIPLAGAVFRIARAATAQEIAAGEAKKLTVDGQILNVVFVSFYDNEALTGEKVTQATSDAQGMVTVYGLAYGTYYLVETQAPAGYQLLGSPVRVQIDATSHTRERIITVVNSSFDLPESGGMGTALFTVVGLACLGGGAAVLLTDRRRRK